MNAPETNPGIGPVILALALASGTLAACGREPSTGGASGNPAEALVERLIAEDPQILLSRDELFNPEQVFDWTFVSAADLEPWQTYGLATTRLHRRRWLLRPAGADPQLVRRLDLDASELHLIEVKMAGLARGAVKLYWAGPGEPFTEERSLSAEPPAQRRRRRFTLSFDLTGHGFWRGAVERLRLDPTDAAGDRVGLRSIRGVRSVPDPERLAAVLGRGWKIDLAADVRSALPAVPGAAVEWQTEVGARQRLRLSYGLEAAIQQAVEFRVEATAEGRSEAEVLLEETLDPAAGAGDRWHEATFDLASYAGQRLRLELETRTLRPLDLVRGFPVWGNPEILGRQQQDGPPNVIMISIDTLRADRLSAYGHHRPTSPNLDRWAASSAVLFENAVVQAPWTLPSHASMFTGLEALRHDVNHYPEAPASLELLAETLRRAGYTTAAITGGGYLRPSFGFAQGFDVFRYWPKILAERELADGTGRMLRWLDENHSRRFFLFFHTYEVHFPHRRRQPYFDQLQGGRPEGPVRGKIAMRARPQKPGELLWQHDYFVVKLPSGEEVEHLNEAEKALVNTMYDSAVAYVDAQLGRLFERLGELGLEGRTLIVLTSDHGEALGEKDRAGHNYLDDYNVLVPLVIEFPDGFGAGEKIDQQVRSIDIVPTILDVLGISPPRPADGVSLLPLIAGDQTAVPAEAWIYASSANTGLALRYRNRLKYVFNNTAWSRLLGAEQLYDLSRDAGEEVDQAASHPSTEELRAKVRQAIEEQHTGLRMRIRNRGRGVLSGRLKNEWARSNRVKAADPSCRCLSWTPGRQAAFSLVANQEVTLYFDSIAGNELGLEGRFEVPGRPEAAFDEIFELGQIRREVGLAYSDGGWQRVPPTGEEAVGFTIWRENEHASVPVSRPVDSKLRAQLEALGYVD